MTVTAQYWAGLPERQRKEIPERIKKHRGAFKRNAFWYLCIPTAGPHKDSEGPNE